MEEKTLVSPVNKLIFMANTDSLLASSGDVSFYFSKYIDDKLAPQRVIIELKKNKLHSEKIKEIISELKVNEELSILSLIKIEGHIYHLPMVDFLSKKRTTKSIEVANEIAFFWNMRFDIYDSGRSIHAYGSKLLSTPQWISFMGSLLLLNDKSGEKVVDTRWIGHRLMSGFASLRVSNNSGKHKSAPKYIGSTDL
ncbi:hypothetical protein GAY20_14575 [Pantoea dispersa]|uniref:primase 1D-like protein n=1 Tax=Pantoea dispersa TaxID=59814 RepID=UPI001266CD1F|nr:hypothetical protein [Pantoea dispersa]QFS61390.1 hypothetical protein GAY20_14575 [Pantoea dispersa]